MKVEVRHDHRARKRVVASRPTSCSSMAPMVAYGHTTRRLHSRQFVLTSRHDPGGRAGAPGSCRGWSVAVRRAFLQRGSAPGEGLVVEGVAVEELEVGGTLGERV